MGQPIRADVAERFRKIEERVSSAVAQEAAALVQGSRRPPPPKMQGAPDGPAPAPLAAETTPATSATVVDGGTGADDLLVTDAAAELLGLSPPPFNRLHVEGRIHAAGKQGHAYLYRRADVEALGERLREERATAAAIAADEITSAEAARHLGVTPSQFSRYRTRGWLRPVRAISRLNVYRRADVEALERRLRDNVAGPRGSAAQIAANMGPPRG
jgi:hypothetical protein